MPKDFDVFLSYNRQDVAVAREVADGLRASGLRPWMDEGEITVGSSWLRELERIIKTCRSVAVLVGPRGLGPWQRKEEAACISESTKRRLPILPVLLPGAPQEPTISVFLEENQWVDLRSGLSGEAWERLIQGIKGAQPESGLESGPATHVMRPGTLRYLLDRHFPRLHSILTQLARRPAPPELGEIRAYLRDLRAGLEQELRQKTRLPLHARTIPAGPDSGRSKDPFVRPIHRLIRQVVGQARGGDFASAQLAAVNRKSKLVKNIVKRLLKSRDPLVLLGDPGSGKTIALQEAAVDLASSELRRVFPSVPIYVRLGEFHEAGSVGSAEVLAHVKRTSSDLIRPWIDSLHASGRLVLLFDGMDEMSRERYNGHTEALSRFAFSCDERSRTLFSCRITDFSPAFVHSRLALLPFDQSQVSTYLDRVLQVQSLQIDGTTWSVSRLARRLASGELPVDATNPFVLWLLCNYLQEEKRWPESRVQLLRFYLDLTYERKQRDAEPGRAALPPKATAMHEWSRIAFTLTERNQGAAVRVAELITPEAGQEQAERMLAMIRAGKECGVFAESIPEKEHLIRFEHHRLQEYFAALWVYENQPSIEWLTKLEAPRWQETMINLVQMGGAESGVKALSNAIQAEVPAFKEASRPLPYEREALLADRVELGARLSRHGEGNAVAVGEELRRCLREAVGTLIERGSPITQVKMMRACQHLKDIDLLATLHGPLSSPIRWVRDHALLLVAAPGLPGRSDLATEMGRDLAINDFLSRWPAYVKALRVANRPSAWACFLLATACALANLALLLVCAWGIFEALRSLYAAAFFASPPHHPEMQSLLAFFASPAHHREMQGLLTLGATAFALRTDRANLWAWVLGSSPVGLLLVNTAFALWQGGLSGVLPGIVVHGGISVLLAPLLIVLGLLLHQATLSLYWVATLRLRSNNGCTTSSFLKLAWAQCGFDSLPEWSRGAGVVMALGLAAWSAYFAFQYLSGEIWPWFSAKMEGWPARVVLLLYLAHYFAFGPVGPRATRMVREQIADPSLMRPLKSLLGHTVSAGTWVKTALGTRAGLRKTSSWVFPRLAGCFAIVVAVSIFAFVPSFVGTFLAKLLVILGLLGALGLLGYVSLLWMRRSLAALRPYPPGSWHPSDWKSALNQGPQKQNEILRRSTHQSLSLKPRDFLQLLVEIEPLIQEEPALSTYLGRRDQLEQAIRQELAG